MSYWKTAPKLKKNFVVTRNPPVISKAKRPLGVFYTLGLWAVGIDLALLIGMGAGLVSFVPYLGSIVGIGAGVVAAFVQYQDWLHPLLVMAVFGAGQTLEGMVLTPKLVGMASNPGIVA